MVGNSLLKTIIFSAFILLLSISSTAHSRQTKDKHTLFLNYALSNDQTKPHIEIIKNNTFEKSDKNDYFFNIKFRNVDFQPGEQYFFLKGFRGRNFEIFFTVTIGDDLIPYYLIENNKCKIEENIFNIGLPARGETADFCLLQKNGKKGAACRVSPKPIEAISEDGRRIFLEICDIEAETIQIYVEGHKNYEKLHFTQIAEGENTEFEGQTVQGELFNTEFHPHKNGKLKGYGELKVTFEDGLELSTHYVWGSEYIKKTTKNEISEVIRKSKPKKIKKM